MPELYNIVCSALVRTLFHTLTSCIKPDIHLVDPPASPRAKLAVVGVLVFVKSKPVSVHVVVLSFVCVSVPTESSYVTV